MSSDRSLGYWYQDTIHYYSHYHNDKAIYDGEGLEVSLGDVRCGYWSLDAI